MIFVGLLVVTSLAAALMSFAVGANDMANVLGTAVGSKAMHLKGAIIIGGLFEFLGCLAMGGNVSSTIAEKLVKIENYENGGERMYMVGMFSALLGSAIWLMVATNLGMPVSTTHTIVSGVYMFGLMVEGWDGIIYDKLYEILLSWVLSPLIGCTIGYIMYYLVDLLVVRSKNPEARARMLLPVLLGVSLLGILQLIFLDVLIALMGDTGKGYKWRYILSAIGLSVLFSIACRTVLWRPLLRMSEVLTANPDFSRLVSAEMSGNFNEFYNPDSTDISKQKLIPEAPLAPIVRKENLLADMYFIPLQILTAGFVAFSHGANDIANSIGPFAAIYSVSKNGNMDDVGKVEFWIIVYGAFFVVLGIALFGVKVMSTVGEKVVRLTNAKSFCVQLSTSWTVLLATYLGLPVSTTHCVVSSVIGVGLVEDRKNFNVKLILAIVVSWLLTVPTGAFFTMQAMLWILGIDALWMKQVADLHFAPKDTNTSLAF